MKIEEAKEYYGTLGRVWCPALEDFIAFDDAGFHHLIWKNRKHRTIADQKRRFRLIPSLRYIIAATKIEMAYQERDIVFPKNRYGEIEAALFNAAFWAFREVREDQIVTVIVRRVGNGEKHFYSVFEKKK